AKYGSSGSLFAGVAQQVARLVPTPNKKERRVNPDRAVLNVQAPFDAALSIKRTVISGPIRGCPGNSPSIHRQKTEFTQLSVARESGKNSSHRIVGVASSYRDDA